MNDQEGSTLQALFLKSRKLRAAMMDPDCSGQAGKARKKIEICYLKIFNNNSLQHSVIAMISNLT
jgi:hypothetical protein